MLPATSQRERLDLDLGIERPQARGRRLGLALADVVGGEQDLALQIGELHHIVVDDAHPADTGRDDVVEHRRAKSAGADDEHRAVAQPVLAALADVLEHELTVVPQALPAGDQHGARRSPAPTSPNSGVDR